MLSTCLSLPSVFVRKQDQSHQLAPYPLKFRPWREAARSYLRVCCTTISTSFGNRAFGWCLVSAPCAEIKPIYCASIRQRERNCFRQLIFRMIDIKVLTKQRTACLHTISARCQIQSTPIGSFSDGKISRVFANKQTTSAKRLGLRNISILTTAPSTHIQLIRVDNSSHSPIRE